MKTHDAFEVSFARLFDERFASLYRYLDRLSGEPDLAEDLAQEAFVRLHRRREIPNDAGAWLVAVASNLFRDERRRARRRQSLLARQPADLTLGMPTPSPDDDVERRDQQVRVRKALDRLSRRDREMLLLRHEGFSYREIATALDVAESGVGTMLIRATEAFRAAFREKNSAPD